MLQLTRDMASTAQIAHIYINSYLHAHAVIKNTDRPEHSI